MSRFWRVIPHPRLVIRLQEIVACALLCLVTLGGLAVDEQHNVMWDARVDKLRAITAQAVSMAAELEQRVRDGGLTREQAIRQFRDAIRPIRYDDGAGYYFGYGMDGMTPVLGPTPAVEGTNRIAFTDADGKPFVRDMAEVARTGSQNRVVPGGRPNSTRPIGSSQVCGLITKC